MNSSNINPEELHKFNQPGARWWDTDGEFKTLHEINPLRVDYIIEHSGGVSGKQVADIGCGGGILSEALASSGAEITAIDMAEDALQAAKTHAGSAQLNIDYRLMTAESLAEAEPHRFDVVTCLEMLEHVPNPAAVISACAKLCKPGGHVFFSTINRHPKAFLLAIVGAEYLFRLLPRGMHEYAQFIKPSELADWSRPEGLQVEDISGLHYNPVTGDHRLSNDVKVNYLMHCIQANH